MGESSPDSAGASVIAFLRGERVALRPRRPEDVDVLHAELYDDVETRARADTRPWRPIPPGSPESPYAVTGAGTEAAPFSVIELGEDELAGEAIVWGIDLHNRVAHLGLALLPAFRGRGLAEEVLRLLCRYGFEARGLNRLQLETTAGNDPMIGAAERAGFVREGTLRQAAWTLGAHEDVVVMGLLAGGRAPLASSP
ncbi:MAG TPA: GNAT family protein [Gaiellaceae bacterium]|jgi:RimJ/RimL family protein N-acetyltransferase|nr:GNAT family protein [Gaiellaceae bacterium]